MMPNLKNAELHKNRHILTFFVIMTIFELNIISDLLQRFHYGDKFTNRFINNAPSINYVY